MTRLGKAKEFTCIGGLVFCPEPASVARLKEKGISVFFGIEGWIYAKCPDNCMVYDHAGALVDAGFPILDALHRAGVYHKVPHTKPRHATLYMCRPQAKARAKFSSGALEVVSEHGVTMVEAEVSKAASGHGKMSRGISHRAKGKK